MDILLRCDAVVDGLLILRTLSEFIKTHFDKHSCSVLASNEEDYELLNNFVVEGVVIQVEIGFDKGSNGLAILTLQFLLLQKLIADLFNVE